MYWLTAILGIVFLFAPFVFGYIDNVAALYTSIAAGLIVLVMSGLEFLRKDREKWEYWVAGATGLVAMIAPFILGFQDHFSALWTSLIVGAMVVIVAGSKLYTTNQRP